MMSEFIHYNVIGFGVLGYAVGVPSLGVVLERLEHYRVWYTALSFILLVPIVSLMCLGHAAYFGKDWDVFMSVTSNLGWYAFFWILIGEMFFSKKVAPLSIDEARKLIEPPQQGPSYAAPPFRGK